MVITAYSKGLFYSQPRFEVVRPDAGPRHGYPNADNCEAIGLEGL